MTKYKTINGWTKARMKAAIREGNNGKKARHEEGGDCCYQTDDGNHCFVGCFIPAGHSGFSVQDDVFGLLRHYPDLSSAMPLKIEPLLYLQRVHDKSGPYANLYELADEWIDANVENGP